MAGKKLLKEGENMVCPHCDHEYTEFECKVEDFVIPGKMGEASTQKDQCEECDKFFTVTRILEGEYMVTAI